MEGGRPQSEYIIHMYKLSKNQLLKLNNNKSNWVNNSLSNYQALRPNNPVGHTAYHFLVDKTKE